MNDIHSYQEFLIWEKSRSVEESSGTDFSRNEIIAPEGYEAININNFISDNCVYCNSILKVFELKNELIETKSGLAITYRTRNFHKKIANVCENCGWWFNNEIKEESYNHNFCDQENWKVGILKKFHINSKDIPINVLRNYLLKNFAIGEINPIVCEKLIRDIYSDFYDCEVKHIGNTGDNGIDLYAVINDEPCIIQVKRRANTEMTERISYIRELIGVLILQNYNYAHLVTTANKFSPKSIDITNSEELKKINIKIDLKTKNDIFSMLNLTNSKMTKPWENF